MTCNRSEAKALLEKAYKSRLARKNKKVNPMDKEPFDADWFEKVTNEKLPQLGDGQKFLTDVLFIHRDVINNQAHFPKVCNCVLMPLYMAVFLFILHVCMHADMCYGHGFF